MELIRQAGNEPPLIGLMRVYKDYYPDVIIGDVTSGRASVFTVGQIYTHVVLVLSNASSIPTESGDKDLMRSRRLTFRKHKIKYRLNSEHLK
jgi:hypothetical protein